MAVLQALEDSVFLALTPSGRFGRAPDRRSSSRCIADSKSGPSACIQSVRKNSLTLDWVCPLIQSRTLF